MRQGTEAFENPFVLHAGTFDAHAGLDQYDFSIGLLGLSERT
jgi:hypothetical protein